MENIKPEIKEKLPHEQGAEEDELHLSFKCQKCDKIVCSEKNLKLHMKRVHLQIKDFFCERCPSSFTTKQELRSHALSHSEERNFKCNQCEKAFKTNSYLKIHGRIHSGEKPYFCEECGKSFSNQSQMISHKKERHSGEIPFQCDACEKGFKTQKYFRLHKKTHLVGYIKKPKTEPERRNHSEEFKLQTIEKAEAMGLRQTAKELGLEPVLIRGWMNVKNEKYKCEKCDGLFAFQSKLIRHIQLKHAENATQNSSWTFDNEFRETVVKFVQDHSIQEALQKFSVSDAAVRMWVKKSMQPIMCVLCGTICAYKRQIREHMSKVHDIKDEEEQDTKYFVRNLAPEPNIVENTPPVKPQFPSYDSVLMEEINLHSDLEQEANNFHQNMESIIQSEHQITSSDSYARDCSDMESMHSSEDDSYDNSEDKELMNFDILNVEHVDNEILKTTEADQRVEGPKQDHLDVKKETIDGFIDVTQMMKVNISEVSTNNFIEPKDEHVYNKAFDGDGSSKTCPICHKVFRDRYKLKVHVLTHTGEKPHSCSLCQQAFALSHQLTRHMLLHKEKTLSCHHCPKMFSDQKLLDLHLKGMNDSFLCNFCTKTFKRKGHLKVHLRMHTGETPYACTSCDAKFHRTSALKEHYIQYHDAPRQMFMCEACGKEYARKGDMLDHMRTHTGEEPFKCGLCNISFSCRRKYVGHKNTHEKNKMCRECGKCFESNANLRRHEKAHAGIKDFQCELCSKAYSSNKSLQQHIEIVHNISNEKSRTFSCPTCDKAFTRNEYLQRHLLKH